MFTEDIRRFTEGIGVAFVATSDAEGNPHLAAGRGTYWSSRPGSA